MRTMKKIYSLLGCTTPHFNKASVSASASVCPFR